MVRSILVFLFLSVPAFASYDIEVLVNGSTELRTEANQLTSLNVTYVHKETGMKPHHYMKMHDKTNHMIIVSDDLEHFAHVHPTFRHMKKDFVIDLNVETAPDPDNLDTVGTIPYAGKYLAFTEVMPHTEEMMMAMNRFSIEATGKKRPAVREYKSISEPGEKLVKYYNNDGREEGFGAKYRATFDYELHQWCSWFLPKFYVLIEVWDSESKSYKKPEELQRWLGMGGHSILISRAELLKDRSFYHLHALLPVAIPGEYVFPYHDHKKGMDDGDYRIFMQFKHDDKVRKVFFDFEYENPPLPEFAPLKAPGFC